MQSDTPGANLFTLLSPGFFKMSRWPTRPFGILSCSSTVRIHTEPTMSQSTFTYDEAYDASLNYFEGDELAARVWVSKYALKDSFGNIYEQ